MQKEYLKNEEEYYHALSPAELAARKQRAVAKQQLKFTPRPIVHPLYKNVSMVEAGQLLGAQGQVRRGGVAVPLWCGWGRRLGGGAPGVEEYARRHAWRPQTVLNVLAVLRVPSCTPSDLTWLHVSAIVPGPRWGAMPFLVPPLANPFATIANRTNGPPPPPHPMQPGDVIFRPSARSTRQLTLTMLLPGPAGSRGLWHLDLKEGSKVRPYALVSATAASPHIFQSQCAMFRLQLTPKATLPSPRLLVLQPAGSLKLGSPLTLTYVPGKKTESYEDLDEVTARFVEPVQVSE